MLSDTDEGTALCLPCQCCQAVEALAIPHEASDCSRYVTMSVGVSTVFPGEGARTPDLCDDVDRLVCGAKQIGRNQVLSASTCCTVGIPRPTLAAHISSVLTGMIQDCVGSMLEVTVPSGSPGHRRDTVVRSVRRSE